MTQLLFQQRERGGLTSAPAASIRPKTVTARKRKQMNTVRRKVGDISR